MPFGSKFHIANDVIVREEQQRGEPNHEQPTIIIIHFYISYSIFEA